MGACAKPAALLVAVDRGSLPDALAVEVCSVLGEMEARLADLTQAVGDAGPGQE
jgi:hypothetical protein